MRYSTSTLFAVIICFVSFLGMSLLVTSPNTNNAKSFDRINFSMVEEMKSPDITTPTKPKVPPPQEKVTQPPALPALDLAANPESPEVFLPTGKAKNLPFEYEKFSINQYNNPTYGMKENGDLKQAFLLEPQYPIIALKNKTEGWVKVEFTVNEFGKVSHFKILESHPNRVFDDAVQRALLKSKFEPAMIEGKAVSQTAVQTVEFKIQN